MARFKEKPMSPDQVLLFSQSVDDALARDCDVRGFNDVMECLDYSIIESKCSSRGCPAYPPKEMVKVLCYAYSKGIRSSRKIEELLKVDIRFIWLSCGLTPDHNTIARFRKEHPAELTRLFGDSVRVCAEAGLVYLNAVATDGSKIKAAASTAGVYGESRLERGLKAVEKILAEAEAVDAAEDKEYGSEVPGELPEHLKDAKERKAKLQEIAKRLKESNKSAIVTTDPDARVMLTHKQTRPCYNLQASVDANSQVMVAMKLTQDEVDFGKLPEMIQEVEQNTGCSPDVSLADCGYCDEKTLRWLGESGHDALIPIKESYRNKRRMDLFASKCFIAEDDRDVLICPAGRELSFRVEHFCGVATYRQYAATNCQSCSFYRDCVPKGSGSRRINIHVLSAQRKAMKERLKSDEGKKLYSLRGQSVEPVFGQIKSNMGFERFLCWGFDGACAEAAIATIAHNIKKCVAKARKAAQLLSIGLLRPFLHAPGIRHCPLRTLAYHSLTAPSQSF